MTNGEAPRPEESGAPERSGGPDMIVSGALSDVDRRAPTDSPTTIVAGEHGWPFTCPPSAPREDWSEPEPEPEPEPKPEPEPEPEALTWKERATLARIIDAVEMSEIGVGITSETVLDQEAVDLIRMFLMERDKAWDVPGSMSQVFEKFLRLQGLESLDFAGLRALAYEAAVREAVESEKFRIQVRERAQRELSGSTAEWVDVAAIIANGVTPPSPPTVFAFSDDPGRALLYEGRYNSIFGDGGVGKTLLTAAVQAWFINQERHVVHLEYDNNPPEQVIWRVVAAGARPELVARYLHVLVTATEIPPRDFTADLVTLDSVNSAISMYDLDPNSSSRGVDTMIHRLIEPFTNEGATALSLDHVGNTNQDRPSNNRRKIQAVQGVMLRVEREGPAGRVGSKWMSRLTLVKDNPGWCPVAVGEVLGFAVYDGTAGDGTCAVSLWRTPIAELAAAHAAQRKTEPRDAVLDIVRGAVGTLTYTVRDVNQQLKDRDVEVSESTVKRILSQLYGQRLIGGEQRGTGRTATWHYFALPAEEA